MRCVALMKLLIPLFYERPIIQGLLKRVNAPARQCERKRNKRDCEEEQVSFAVLGDGGVLLAFVKANYINEEK